MLILVTYAVIGVGMSIVVDPWIMVIIGAVMFGIMSASTITMDKSYGWRKLAATLPVSKETTVDSKYLLYLLSACWGSSSAWRSVSSSALSNPISCQRMI